MKEQAVSNQIQQPPEHTVPVSKKPNQWIIALIVFVSFLVIGSIYILNLRLQKQMIPPPPEPPLPPKITLQPSPSDETANWKTYVDSDNKFSVKYPPNLIMVGGAFYKKDDFERAKPAGPATDDFLENYLARITVTTYTSRFEAYYNALENAIVKGYSDTILKKYAIDGYKAIEYGYDKQKKEEDVKEQEEALRSGASVTMIYFEKGLMINRKGTIIEISTLSYYGDFKNTFDQILSTFKFTDQDQIACTQDVKTCLDGSYVSRQAPNCEFAACPQK